MLWHMRYFLLIPVFILAACAQGTQLPDVNGKSSFLIECDGMAVPWSACYKKAAELCGNKYVVTEKNQGGSSMFGTSGFDANPNYASGGSAISGASGIQKSITVVCGITPKLKR